MSKIEWTTCTWNPFVGCSKKSSGCRNCYAMGTALWQAGFGRKQYEDVADRKGGKPVWTGKINRAPDNIVEIPLNRKVPTLYFICSMSDFFHPNASDDLRLEVLDIIEQCPQHTFQILTKRPENIVPFLERNDVEWPDNVWIGTTVEDRRAKKRIIILQEVPATNKFLSIEPLLEDLGKLRLDGVDWVIVGGESGKGARPMQASWVRRIQKQCRMARVPFFFKQWGVPENNPIALSTPPGTKVAEWVKQQDPIGKGGSLLDGKHYKPNPCRK